LPARRICSIVAVVGLTMLWIAILEFQRMN